MNFSFIESVAKKLMADFEASKVFKHNGLKGDVREQEVSNFLEKHLPEKFKIGSGIVVNSDGDQSRQQDIIIYDAFNAPLLHNEENTKIIPVESVYGTIEVKSTLSKRELITCIENIKSIKALSKLPHPIPHGFVFAFQADSTIENVCENVVELNKEVDLKYRINTVCILDQGTILHFHKHGLNNIHVIPNEDCYLGSLKRTPEKNLTFFYLLLVHEFSRKQLIPPNLIEYASKQNLLTADSKFPFQEFSDDTYYQDLRTGKRIYLKPYESFYNSKKD
ncbi:hypothetical protein PDL05_11090 [Bacillus cereus group sp. BY112LC]|uniref:DUF6602 domain-containing protein n=1 Tax=Bacillus cereus group sp. BY112LC TaxID=3018086 RepID=UPI0022E6A964|nr:DUF6602 domain-containing protein [Bacillus cereus group sp. BY112LC]MDA1874287.1 hypothetical protein [Bacillus cereus group sp. BY112LC]